MDEKAIKRTFAEEGVPSIIRTPEKLKTVIRHPIRRDMLEVMARQQSD